MTDTTTDTTTTDQTTETTQGAGASADQTSTQKSSPADKTAGKTGDKAAGDHGTTKGPGLKAEDDAPWYSGLPDDLKSEKTLLRHANVEDAMRALVGAEKRLGVPADQLVRLPTKPEEQAELYRKLGAPETADGYQITLPDGATDDDKAAAKSFAEYMHKHGPFPPDFVNAALGWNNAQTEAAQAALAEAQAARQAEGIALLKSELKGSYDPDMKAVGKLLNDLGGPELAEELNLSGHGDNPRLMLLLQKIVDERSESQTLDGGNSGTATIGGITPGQAKAAVANLENDPVKGVALRDKTHSMHASVLAERTRLVRISEGIDPDA